MRTAREKSALKDRISKVPRPRRPKARARDLSEFHGILSTQEAEKMMRDIEEAFEKVDAE